MMINFGKIPCLIMADSKMWRGLKPNKAKKVFELYSVATREFDEKDFRMLVKATHEVFSKWENIGVCLSIPAQTMDDLGHKWRRSAVRGMISILDEWVKGHHGVVALHPCWHSLVYVVADAIGGGNPAAASNIARNWKEYEKDPFFYYPKAKEAESSPLDVQQKTPIATGLYSDFLHRVKAHWFEIGVLLGVPIAELEALEQEDTNHMIKVIERWIDLSMDGDFDYLPPPTLQVLSDAVANKMGGNNAGLAIKLIGAKSLSQTSLPGSANPGSPPSSVHPASPPGSVNPLSPPGSASPGSVNPASPPDSAHINAVPHQQYQSGQQPQTQPGVPREFSDSMSPDQLYSWLLSMKLPENDCKIIKDKGITGIAFKFLPEAEWRKYGISNVHLLLHFQQKVSPKNTSSNETPLMDTSGSKVSSGANKFPVERPQPVNHCDKYWQYVNHFKIGDQRWKLEAMVSDNEIIRLAKHLLTWETELPALLNLTPTDISDIHSGISDREPLKKRQRALQIWKKKDRLNATFESLLEICLRGGDSRTAEDMCVYIHDNVPEGAKMPSAC